ncbi:alpha-2-macroglobulin family protein [Ferruginibacter sp.]
MFLKKILLVILTGITFTTMAQTNNEYLKNWNQVAFLEEKGLTKSALKEVIAIYNLAVKDNNDAQQIKSCMYQVKYRNTLEEDGDESNIFFVDTLIAKAKSPAKNILQSMQAEMFWYYLQHERWQFYDRTAFKEEKSKDISTWSIDKLNNTIAKLYKASLKNETLLKTTKLDAFLPIIVKGENTDQLLPTLYDFLAHRALAYFKTGEDQVTKPAYEFKINDPIAFAPAAEFVNASFKTADTASLQYNTLLILQDVLKFHLNDTKADALLDADLLRLNFVYNYTVLDDKEKRYEEALKDIETRFQDNPLVAQAVYSRALIYYRRGEQYEANTRPIHQYELKRAKELCDAAIKKFPKSEGAINCRNLVALITKPSLSIGTEEVNTINDPFRSLVRYKNISKVYFRIIKTSTDELKNLDRSNYEKMWSGFVALKPFKSWSSTLPDLNDFQQHSTEVKVDGLGGGIYLLLASIEENFALAKNIITSQVIYVSNISYIRNSNNEYYVLHRDNGQPIANAQVQVWDRNYSSQSSRWDKEKAEKYSTDKNGMFKMRLSSSYRNFSLQVSYNNDELFLDDTDGYNVYNDYEAPKTTPRIFLFTDRSIYRPGQTMYFKGIAVKPEKDAGKSAVIPGYKTKIVLRNANDEKTAELSVTGNDFGSFKGSFKLPEGVLNGNFSLFDSVTNSYAYFSVEEYKRPKFFTEIEKPKGTYRLNDSIKITGTAKAYAGNNIDDAKVKYRVVRKVRYPIWWQWGYISSRGRSKSFYTGNDQTEITNGEVTTDSKGGFTITFKALPDESVSKESQPVFNYEVSADVTDINGETRSGSTSVAVAYQMLQLNIDMAEKITADSLKKLQISSTNLNDIFEKASVHVTITQLRSPGKIYRERYWDMPDQFVMSKDEFSSYFPYDIYKDEDKKSSWPLGDKVVEATDSTSENSIFNIPRSSFTAGWYKIVAATKDKYGETVKAEKYVQLIDSKQQAGSGEAITIDARKQSYQPGENIEYNVSTGFDNVWMIHTMSTVNQNPGISYHTVQKNMPQHFSYVVTEDRRGGMAVNYVFVQHNRVYKEEQEFSIPWSNKELNIAYSTFRDKLLPGANEKWTVKITGNKGEKVAAEMLAGMYDASLDQFKQHSWSRINIWPYYFNTLNWIEKGFTQVYAETYNKMETYNPGIFKKTYDKLAYFGGVAYGDYDWDYFVSRNFQHDLNPDARYNGGFDFAAPASMALQGKVAGLNVGNSENNRKMKVPKPAAPNLEVVTTAVPFLRVGGDAQSGSQNNDAVQVRKNFNETAFFFPDLRTDAEGNVSFEFTIPEALTKWKLMTLAHTKDLASGYSEATTITQKPLMVQPNAPRFLREGDAMEFTAKIVNLGDSEVTGTAQLELLDAATNKPVDGWFKNVFPTQYFTAAAGQSTVVKFPMEVPFNFNSAMSYRIVAKTNNASDGEEMALPVLTNRMLVTESMPLNMRKQTSKTFTFDKLINSEKSSTIKNHALTVEYTSNPAWYAVQALPYLMEYPYECAEQTFNRYYANVLATYISNSTPKIKAVFEKWKTVDTAALLSNLQKNEELKSVLLQETPWVLEAKNEQQQKKNIALLFDMVKMSSETSKAFNALKDMQGNDGGFVWFKGGPDNRYITQYIITGIGHLRKLKALGGDAYQKLKPVVDRGIAYLDQKIKEDFDNLVRYKAKLSNNNLSDIQVQYLYLRSFFPEYKIQDPFLTAYNYYRGQSQKFWLKQSKYTQAMIALSLYRTKDEVTPKAIIKSLKENAIIKEEMGMYWKEWTTGGYYWYQAPIESQAMMIEAFTDIDKNNATIDDLKTWLLKQKQTQNWKTTKATAEACYALLLNGSNWLSEEKEVTIQLGNTTVKSTDAATEAGTGYFKKTIEADKIKPAMGNIVVTTNSKSASQVPLQGDLGGWGSVYWQYFEDLDKITPSETPLKLKKQLFVERNTDKGPVLEALSDGAVLKVGDKVKVRIVLKVDRDMEYVHMKDMRAACMEPVNVLSEYKYQGGLGYYESTKDASTNFFFGWLNRGTYVFEYPLFVTHTGNFSNGITSIQCMYAPEFTSHSEGTRVNVE